MLKVIFIFFFAKIWISIQEKEKTNILSIFEKQQHFNLFLIEKANNNNNNENNDNQEENLKRQFSQKCLKAEFYFKYSFAFFTLANLLGLFLKYMLL